MLIFYRRLLYLLLGGGSLIAADQLSKWGLEFLRRQPIDWDWGKLVWYENFGISFGIGLPTALSLLLIIIFLAILIGWWFTARSLSGWLRIGLIFCISGGISNLIDRFSLGYVRDFVSLPFFPIFNLADVLVIAGVVLILISLYRYDRSKV